MRNVCFSPFFNIYRGYQQFIHVVVVVVVDVSLQGKSSSAATIFTISSGIPRIVYTSLCIVISIGIPVSSEYANISITCSLPSRLNSLLHNYVDTSTRNMKNKIEKKKSNHAHINLYHRLIKNNTKKITHKKISLRQQKLKYTQTLKRP